MLMQRITRGVVEIGILRNGVLGSTFHLLSESSPNCTCLAILDVKIAQTVPVVPYNFPLAVLRVCTYQ